MLHNQTHKIVHSSAMYYQNFIIIHERSKKLLKMKNSKLFLMTPSTSMKSERGLSCLLITQLPLPPLSLSLLVFFPFILISSKHHIGTHSMHLLVVKLVVVLFILVILSILVEVILRDPNILSINLLILGTLLHGNCLSMY